MRIFCSLAMLLAIGAVAVCPHEARGDDAPSTSAAPKTATAEARQDAFDSEKRDPVQAQLQAQIAELNIELAALQTSHGEQSPRVKMLKQQISVLEFGARAMAEQAARQVAESSLENGADVGLLTRQAEAYARKAAEYAKQLEQRDQQIDLLATQMRTWEQDQNVPPIEGEVKIFRLANVPAPDAAKQILSLFGARAVRVALDGRTNSLIVFGKSDLTKSIEAILTQLDAQGQSNEATSKAVENGSGSRSVLLRVFWLADGLPEGEGGAPEAFLPAAVVKATMQLGLDGPRLVAQTVNSLASRGDEPVEFSTHVPAIVFKQPAQLECEGAMTLAGDDRASFNVHIGVNGSVNCELSGSLVSPIGHYMVLGTANSIANAMEMAPGMGMGGMPGGYGGGFAERGEGGGFGAGGAMGLEGGATPPDPNAAAGPEGGVGAAPPEPKFKASRFAFVVQVIDGVSYAPEK